MGQEEIWGKNTKRVTVNDVIRNYNYPIPSQNELKEFINEYAKKDIRIIEVGCNTGVTSFLLNDIFDKTLLDLNEEAINLAKSAAIQLVKKAKFVVADMFKMPFEDKHFNIAFNAGVVEHFNQDERELLLKEYSRILDDDGIMIIAFPNHYSLPYRSAYMFYNKILFGYKWRWPKEFKIFDMHQEIKSNGLVLKKRLVIAKKQVFGFWGVFKLFWPCSLFFKVIDKIFNFEGYLTVLVIAKK